MTIRRLIPLLCAFGAAVPAGTAAQSLAQRVESAPEGTVVFSFAARPGVCGNGRSFISVHQSLWIGSHSASDERECIAGPVRVELTRAGQLITDIDTFVGPMPAEGVAGTNLGIVGAAAAAEYLLRLAARADGEPSKAAIMPAMLADSAEQWSSLLAIARDANRPRETRRTAISWMGRSVAGGDAAAATRAVDALAGLARARGDNPAVREQAVRTLARLDGGHGVPTLIEMTRTDDPWLAREALSTVARTGDPRARDLLRQIVRQPGARDDILEVAIRGLGGSYATGSDGQLLRESYAGFTTTSSKERLITVVASMGGRDNVQWLLGLAADEAESVSLRRKALQGANKADAPIDAFVSAYKRLEHRALKEALIDIFARRSEQAATDQLLAIATGDEDAALRKRAIQRLSRSDDPRVAEALKGIVGTR